MRKILVVDFNGTTPIYTNYFAKNLKSNKTEVEILGYKNETELKYLKKEVKYIEINLYSKLLNYFCYWGYLFIFAKKYDILIIEWLPFLKYSVIELYLIGFLQKRIKKSELYYTVHNFYPHNSQNIKLKKRYEKLYKNLSNLLVHTNETKIKLKKIGVNGKISEINHGPLYYDIDIEEKKDMKMLSMLGTISEYKGIEDALKAMEILKENKFYLYIAGKGDIKYINKLKKIICEKKMEKNIFLKEGYLSTEEIIKLTKKSAVTLMPYKQIEQSGVALTSIGLNTPIVGYKVGGLKDVIVNSWNGYLVNSGDYEKLAYKVIETIDNYENILLRSKILSERKGWQENLKLFLESRDLNE
ncbi:glycosyltransferase [uncultured Cetobacterium sp.]|uniref:glycosyltransferase n=1 Tax=uncultured Cetobacterium sp. TaxID=527638 RepID=UPI0025EF5B78|nr:glycosyltransferase [uncultured Cetobacterium sp.]